MATNPTIESAGTGSPFLNPGEKDRAAAHTAPRALILHEILRADGEAALLRPSIALAFSALAAGLSMGFSFLGQALLQAALPDRPWRPLLASFGYTMGFVIVILGRQQLFTENTLTTILPVLTRRDRATLMAAIRLWLIVLSANLLGTILFALLLLPAGTFKPEVEHALQDISLTALNGHFAAIFLKSVFAGWLIALMVWILPSARAAGILVIWLITYLVALAHLSHIIAGSAEAAYAVLSGGAEVSDYVVQFMLPTLLGNILGGVALVGLLNHGAIAAEIRLPMDQK